jgi:hypothetical protein
MVNVVLLAASQWVILTSEGEPDLVFDPESPEELQESIRADLVDWLARIYLVIFGRKLKACRIISRYHRLLVGSGQQQNSAGICKPAAWSARSPQSARSRDA